MLYSLFLKLLQIFFLLLLFSKFFFVLIRDKGIILGIKFWSVIVSFGRKWHILILTVPRTDLMILFRKNLLFSQTSYFIVVTTSWKQSLMLLILEFVFLKFSLVHDIVLSFGLSRLWGGIVQLSWRWWIDGKGWWIDWEECSLIIARFIGIANELFHDLVSKKFFFLLLRFPFILVELNSGKWTSA